MRTSLNRFLVVATLAVAIASRAFAQDGGIELGARAPVRAISDISGKPVNVSTYVGKTPVLLEFWATWCENCRALEPQMLAMQKKYASQMTFIGVAVPINQTLDRVQRYVAQHKYPYLMLWDKDGNFAADYDVPATSFVVVIDKTGKVVYTGAGGKQNLEAAIKKGL